MPRLSKESMLAKAKASMEPFEVEVPEWGEPVLVRPLTMQDINECIRKASNDVRGGEVNPNVRNGWYLVTAFVDPEITLAEAEVLLTESAAGPITMVLDEILTKSGLTERAKDAAKSAAAEVPAAAVPDAASGTAGEDANRTPE